MDGVLDATCVYIGGETLNPTYQSIQDHTEGIHVTFDPSIISYRQLVEFFFTKASISTCSGSKQYQTGLWWHNATQKEIVETVISDVESKRGSLDTIHRSGVTASGVYKAEEYHQKFLEKNPSMSW